MDAAGGETQVVLAALDAGALVGAVCLTPAGAEVQRLAVRRPDGTLAANAFFYLVL